MSKINRRSNGKKVAIYVRVSREDQSKHGYSIEFQIAKAMEYCNQEGYEVVSVLEDHASGKSKKRKGLQKALEMLQSGEVAGIVFWRLDRFTRSIKDAVDFLEVSGTEGWDIESISERLDTKTANGRHYFWTTVVNAQTEREKLSERVKEGLDQARKLGGKTGGEDQYGYKAVSRKGKKRLVEVPGEQKVIDRARELHKKGCKVSEIVKTLNDEGARTRKGTMWSHSQVSRLLNNAIRITA